MQYDEDAASEIAEQSDPLPNCVQSRGEPLRKAAKHGKRSDKSRLHVTRHGILSRQLFSALARRGENIRALRQTERLLRAELNPKGIVAEILFDRAVSSWLRCLLIAHAESSVFAPEQVDGGRHPRLRDGEVPTLVFSEYEQADPGLGTELVKRLAILQRYDNHYSREFYRAVTLLLAMKNGGNAALTEFLGSTHGGRETSEG